MLKSWHLRTRYMAKNSVSPHLSPLIWNDWIVPCSKAMSGDNPTNPDERGVRPQKIRKSPFHDIDKPFLIESSVLRAHGFAGVFTTRRGGTSPVPFDSLNFADNTGDDPQHVAWNLELLKQHIPFCHGIHTATQMHGTGAIWVSDEPTKSATETQPQADVLFTRDAGVAVAVRTADCLPLLLADPQTGICAAVHAGWRGTAAGIAKQAVEQMRAHGSIPGRILAALGPCIGACCFAIGDEVADALSRVSKHPEHIRQHKDGGYAADLALINREHLLSSGLKNENIEMLNRCTCCHPELFFSYRRDGAKSGRQLALVMRRE